MNPMTRRGVLAGVTAVAATPAWARIGAEDRLIAGTYAREGGKGLYPVAGFRVGSPLTGIVDASFGTGPGPAGCRYFVDEATEGRVGAYGPDWTPRGSVSTGGADPAHITLDRASACLAVANYSSGDIAFIPLDPRTGAPGAARLFAHHGSGPDQTRQKSAHAHWVGFSPDRRWLHAVDLGADAIFAYRFDPDARTLTADGIAWTAPAGMGPRHMIRHPRLPRAYVVGELDNRLVTLESLPDGRFATRHAQSTLPAGFGGTSYAAHIAIDRTGRFLYVSNRGHDSVAVFALDRTGTPTAIQHIGSGGAWPRFFLLRANGREMLVANEHTGLVCAFAIGGDGRLSPTPRRLAIPGVVFLAEL